MAVLLILACLWAVVLLPPLLRARTDNRSSDSIGDFNYRLDVLSRTGGATSTNDRGIPLPGTAARRRRDVLRVLLGSVTLTMLLAFVTGAPLLWAVNIIADALLVAYLLMWAYVRSAHAERVAKLRYLPTPTPAQPHSARELARTGSS